MLSHMYNQLHGAVPADVYLLGLACMQNSEQFQLEHLLFTDIGRSILPMFPLDEIILVQ